MNREGNNPMVRLRVYRFWLRWVVELCYVLGLLFAFMVPWMFMLVRTDAHQPLLPEAFAWIFAFSMRPWPEGMDFQQLWLLFASGLTGGVCVWRCFILAFREMDRRATPNETLLFDHLYSLRRKSREGLCSALLHFINDQKEMLPHDVER